MDCTDCRQNLYAFLDGELDESTLGFLNKHLEGCMKCFRRSQVERTLRTVVRATAMSIPLPEGFEERLRRALDRQEQEFEPEVPRRPSGEDGPGQPSAG